METFSLFVNDFGTWENASVSPMISCEAFSLPHDAVRQYAYLIALISNRNLTYRDMGASAMIGICQGI